MYSEKVMDHFNHPRNVGEMENPSGVGTVGNAKCGDIKIVLYEIFLKTGIRKDFNKADNHCRSDQDTKSIRCK